MNPPADEREARIELAAALRIAVMFDFHEGISNHFSMLIPGQEDRFLINPFGLHFSEITASSLAVVDVDGTPISGTAPDTGIEIHAPIHRLCPQATTRPVATTCSRPAAWRARPAGSASRPSSSR